MIENNTLRGDAAELAGQKMIIDTLWSTRIDDVLGTIAAGENSHQELAAVTEYMQADYHGRFLVELIQNANDQAIEIGETQSTVTIVRGKDFVAIGNQGAPFSTKGIRSIASVGMSTKNPALQIGNKGIGFKSVFQITKEPEIFSAIKAGDSYSSDLCNAFRISLSVFDDSENLSRLKDIASGVLVNNPSQNEKLLKLGSTDPLEDLVTAVTESAASRYPIPIGKDLRAARAESLGDLESCPQTIIFLPFEHGSGAELLVDEAIEEVFGCRGASILFLDGVACLELIDQTSGIYSTIVKENSDPEDVDHARASFSFTKITVSRGAETVSYCDWVTVTSIFGSHKETDSSAINAAALKLPGHGFDKVDRCPVAIALPVSEPLIGPLSDHDDECGRICIGLPTKDLSGTRAWVHSHFFGNISRKEIDLQGIEFNRLLFEEAIRLHGVLLERLRRDSSRVRRRAVTAAYDFIEGPLWNRISAAVDFVKEPIVLANNGTDFLTIEDVYVFEADDYELVQDLVIRAEATDLLECMPDETIGSQMSSVLKALEDICKFNYDPYQGLLNKGETGQSVLERGAEDMRRDQTANWRNFLDWVVSRYENASDLRNQKILPTGDSSLCAASGKVFLMPMAANPGGAEDDDIEGGSEDLELLPSVARDHLHFIDEKVLKVRTGKRRELTELAAKLAPERGGLVRRPRLNELINESVAPCLQSLDTTDVCLVEGLELLALVARWLSRMTSKSIGEVNFDQLRVPAHIETDLWEWAPPTACYFGAGWLDKETEELVKKAYGARKAGRLIAWQKFLSLAPEYFHERAQAYSAFESFGVRARPRLMAQAKDKRKRAPLLSLSNNFLSVQDDVLCPVPVAQEYWLDYLTICAQRSALTRTGQKFDFGEVSWVDGLERAESRAAIVTLMLKHPDEYDISRTTTLGRQEYDTSNDTTNVPSLWAYTLKSRDWVVLPTNNGYKPPSEVWMLQPGQTSKHHKRLGVISYIHGFTGADRILQSIGVASLAQPSVQGLTDELGRLADELNAVSAGDHKNYLAMAQDLYSKLARALDDEGEEETKSLPDLSGRCLPLLQNGSLCAVEADKIGTAYVADDFERARFIAGYESSLIWPIEATGKYRVLALALQDALGADSACLASEVSVETGFKKQPNAQHNFLDWLLAAFPSRAVASDLGCLIAYSGERNLDPDGNGFRTHWRNLQTSTLEIGRFPAGFATKAFFDVSAVGSPVLQLDDELDDFGVLAETWRLIGRRYEYTWVAYANALENADVDAFFAGKVSESRREDVDAVTGMGYSRSLLPLKAVFLAIRRERLKKLEDLATFESQWDKHSVQLSRFLDWMESVLSAEKVEASLNLSLEHQVIEVLTATGTSYSSWQQARADLGQERYAFECNKRDSDGTKRRILAVLMATAARSPLTDLVSLKEAFIKMGNVDLTENHCWEPLSVKKLASLIIAAFRENIDSLPADKAHGLLSARLKSLARLAPSEVDDLSLEPVPERDVGLYVYKTKQERSEEAVNYLSTILSVVGLVAPHFNEELNPELVSKDARISLLTSGFWANAFSLLPSIQRCLEKSVPNTFKQLTERRVFVSKGKLTKNEMLKIFPEVSKGELIAEKQQPLERFKFFGMELDERRLDDDIALGPMGDIGKQLIEQAFAAENPIGSSAGERSLVPASRSKSTARSLFKPKSRPSAGSRKLRNYVGLFGEIYIYERLKTAGLPGFDEAVWVSENRRAYAGDDSGNDSLGYDFVIQDLDGRISGCKGVRCLIEVKSTSGSADGPFQLSENEWSCAVEAHHDADCEYLIYRVANATAAEKIELADVIQDPYCLRKKGQLRLENSDFWVHVGLK